MDTLYLKTEELNEVDIDSDNIVELKDNEFSAMENGSTNKKRLPSDPPVVNMSNYDSEDENLVILNMNNTKKPFVLSKSSPVIEKIPPSANLKP